MSLVDSVSMLPGGGELSGFVSKLAGGDPAAIRAVATRWRGAAGKVNEYTGDLGAAVNTVDAAWQGKSSEAFGTYMRKYGKAGEALHDALSDCASSLDTAATALETAKSEVDATCGSLLETRDVVTYLNSTSSEERKKLEPSVASSVSGATSYARISFTAAENAVTKAMGDITKQMENRPLSFVGSYIGAPGEQTFLPQPGHPFLWERTASYGQAGGPDGNGPGGAGGNGSGGGFGGYGPSGPPPPGGGPAPSGKVKEWIDQAIEILKDQGYPVEKMNPNDIWMIIQHESGGNPNAINEWDSNAAAGHPSKGLMQTIDPTFNSHKLPGHGDIYNPVDNIIAGVRYAIDRYGSVSNVPGVVGSKTGSGYVGY
jgi:WXG100 family type VII secretion target